MLAAPIAVNSKGSKFSRRGVAAVEFAFCFPIMLLILFGMWEVGRITEVQNVSWNSAREGARDASMGQANLLAVANNLQLYLQGAEPGAFGKGHSISMIAPVVTLPANTYGYTCWDNTANQELFTVTFIDKTNTSVTDPTAMNQLDVYELTIQVPYSSIGWLPVPQITGMTRLYTTVDWASLVDSPFQTVQSLPAQ